MRQVIKVNEVAEIIGVSPMTLRRWLKNGEGPPCKISPTGIYLFERSVVDAWWDALPEAPKAVSKHGNRH